MDKRSLEPLTPKALVDGVLFSSLDWPGKTVRLERDTVAGYCQRSVSSQPSIAELYHENSKLFPSNVAELGATRTDIEGVRREFLTRRSTAITGIPDAHVSPLYRELMTYVVATTSLSLFYAIELRLVEDKRLLTHEPLTNRLISVKQFSEDDLRGLQIAINLLTGKESAPRLTLFLIANFARNDLLFGVRGYRRTLLEAGQVMSSALNVLSQAGINTAAHYEFHDRSLDLLLEADGVEEAVIAAIECG